MPLIDEKRIGKIASEINIKAPQAEEFKEFKNLLKSLVREEDKDTFNNIIAILQKCTSDFAAELTIKLLSSDPDVTDASYINKINLIIAELIRLEALEAKRTNELSTKGLLRGNTIAIKVIFKKIDLYQKECKDFYDENMLPYVNLIVAVSNNPNYKTVEEKNVQHLEILNKFLVNLPNMQLPDFLLDTVRAIANAYKACEDKNKTYTSDEIIRGVAKLITLRIFQKILNDNIQNSSNSQITKAAVVITKVMTESVTKAVTWDEFDEVGQKRHLAKLISEGKNPKEGTFTFSATEQDTSIAVITIESQLAPVLQFTGNNYDRAMSGNFIDVSPSVKPQLKVVEAPKPIQTNEKIEPSRQEKKGKKEETEENKEKRGSLGGLTKLFKKTGSGSRFSLNFGISSNSKANNDEESADVTQSSYKKEPVSLNIDVTNNKPLEALVTICRGVTFGGNEKKSIAEVLGNNKFKMDDIVSIKDFLIKRYDVEVSLEIINLFSCVAYFQMAIIKNDPIYFARAHVKNSDLAVKLATNNNLNNYNNNNSIFNSAVNNIIAIGGEAYLETAISSTASFIKQGVTGPGNSSNNNSEKLTAKEFLEDLLRPEQQLNHDMKLTDIQEKLEEDIKGLKEKYYEIFAAKFNDSPQLIYLKVLYALSKDTLAFNLLKAQQSSTEQTSGIKAFRELYKELNKEEVKYFEEKWPNLVKQVEKSRSRSTAQGQLPKPVFQENQETQMGSEPFNYNS